MLQRLILFVFIMISFVRVHAQAPQKESKSHATQSISLHFDQYLWGHPLIFKSGYTFRYSRSIIGLRQHRLGVSPQAAIILIPDIKNMFVFMGALHYSYESKKGIEASFFLGANYILTRLAYDRYEYENNAFENKGRLLHHVGPSVGLQVGYKILKRRGYSLSPFIGISLIQSDKNYKPSLFTGYKPSLNIGIRLNK